MIISMLITVLMTITIIRVEHVHWLLLAYSIHEDSLVYLLDKSTTLELPLSVYTKLNVQVISTSSRLCWPTTTFAHQVAIRSFAIIIKSITTSSTLFTSKADHTVFYREACLAQSTMLSKQKQ